MPVESFGSPVVRRYFDIDVLMVDTDDMVNAQAFNPYAKASAAQIAGVLFEGCREGLSAEECEDLSRLLGAILPALVELRDSGLMDLTGYEVVDHATIHGLIRLASNGRISQDARDNCRNLRDQLVANAVHMELLRRQLLTGLQ